MIRLEWKMKKTDTVHNTGRQFLHLHDERVSIRVTLEQTKKGEGNPSFLRQGIWSSRTQWGTPKWPSYRQRRSCLDWFLGMIRQRSSRATPKESRKESNMTLEMVGLDILTVSFCGFCDAIKACRAEHPNLDSNLMFRSTLNYCLTLPIDRRRWRQTSSRSLHGRGIVATRTSRPR